MPVDDLRRSRTWGIEDTTTGVAGTVHGNFKTAQREAFKLCEHSRAPVNIYAVDGREWTHEAVVKP